jgi:hypothetical protein
MRSWDSVKAAASGVEDDGSFDSPKGPEDCEERRAAALAVTAEALALPGDWGDRPYGIIIEAGGPRGATSIIAFATGESSLHTSSGSGIIGRQNHVHVVTQAKHLVKRAADHVSMLEPATEFPKPLEGAIRFYVLTRRGIFTREESTWTVRGGESPVSPLLDAADELMSELEQYLWTRHGPVSPPRPLELLKAVAIVATIAALTCAAWFIPIAWLRWPAVAIGVFFTIAAAIVPYAMVRAPGLSGYDPDQAAAG